MMLLNNKQIEIVKKYGQYFNNHGGNDIVNLLERKDINPFNNYIVAELQSCCMSQLLLIETLIKFEIIKADL